MTEYWHPAGMYRYKVRRLEEGWLLIADRNFFNFFNLADWHAVAWQQDLSENVTQNYSNKPKHLTSLALAG
jgi:hypothetical protein